MHININDTVRVKLNDLGLQILEQQHNNLYKLLKKPQPFVPPKEDKNGYVKFQLWDLMHIFGRYTYLGGHVPFDTEIIIGGNCKKEFIATVQKLIDYNWKDELRDYEETYDLEFDDEDMTIEHAINNPDQTHIFCALAKIYKEIN